MANLRVDLNEPLLNGMDITFKAPCDCTAVTGLIVYAPDNEGAVSSRTFTFKDAHGNALNGVGNLFETNALVKVMVDLDTSSAYLLNADTNKYLEEKIANAGTKVTLSSAVNSTSTTTAANSYAVKQAYDKAAAAIPSSQKGVVNGVAPLSSNGKMDKQYLPFTSGTLTLSLPTNVAEGYTSFSQNDCYYLHLGDFLLVYVSFWAGKNNGSHTDIRINVNGLPSGLDYGIWYASFISETAGAGYATLSYSSIAEPTLYCETLGSETPLALNCSCTFFIKL